MATYNQQRASDIKANTPKNSMPADNIYRINDNPDTLSNFYGNFLEAETSQAQVIFQDVVRQLSNNPAPAGSNYNNAWEYLKALLVAKGYSKSKNPVNIPDYKDLTGLKNALIGAQGRNAELTTYLEQNIGGGGGGTPIVQKDTTPLYNKQISTALYLKDEGDARAALNDAYFLAFGERPSDAVVQKFNTQWNTNVIEQRSTVTTKGATTFKKVYDKTKPVIDPKTKKQKLNKDGTPQFQQLKDKKGVYQFETVNATDTVTINEGFSAKEQEQFLADYISTNFPNDGFDPATIGGEAKAIYDDMVGAHKSNYDTAPEMETLIPTIRKIISARMLKDPDVATEMIRQYRQGVQSSAATRFMSIADQVNAGEDASKYVAPTLKRMSDYLETEISIDDPLAKRIFNFQGSDGKFRQPNDYELQGLLDADSRNATTSRSINTSINMADRLAERLRN